MSTHPPLSLSFSPLIKSFNRDDTLSIILNHCYARVQTGQWRILSHQDLWQFYIFDIFHFAVSVCLPFDLLSFQHSLYLFILFRLFDFGFLTLHFVNNHPPPTNSMFPNSSLFPSTITFELTVMILRVLYWIIATLESSRTMTNFISPRSLTLLIYRYYFVQF